MIFLQVWNLFQHVSVFVTLPKHKYTWQDSHKEGINFVANFAVASSDPVSDIAFVVSFLVPSYPQTSGYH